MKNKFLLILINSGMVINTSIKSSVEVINISVIIFLTLFKSFTRDTISPAFLEFITLKGRLYK